MCLYLVERKLALQQMMDKKNTFLVKIFSRFCPVFTLDKLCFWLIEDCPVSDKIFKIMANYPHLLSIADNRRCV